MASNQQVPDDKDTLELAAASQEVLEQVEGTLEAVSEKLYELLSSELIDLSEDDIRELLSDDSPSTKKAPSDEGKTMTETTDGHPETEEERTASTSVVSTEEDPESPAKSFHSQMEDHEMDPNESNGDEQQWDGAGHDVKLTTNTITTAAAVVTDDEASSDEDDIMSVVTTATRRELKNRVGALEGTLEAFYRQMQELNNRVVDAENEERTKQSTAQEMHDKVLAETTHVIEELETKYIQNESEKQEMESKMQAIKEAQQRVAKAVQEKQALEQKTQELQGKLSTMCNLLLQYQNGSAAPTVNVARSVEIPQITKTPGNKSSPFHQQAILAVVLAAFVVTMVARDHLSQMDHNPLDGIRQQRESIVPVPPITNDSVEEDVEIPILTCDFTETLFNHDVIEPLLCNCDDDDGKDEDAFSEKDESVIALTVPGPKLASKIAHILRGIKVGQIWEKIRSRMKLPENISVDDL